MKVRVAGDHLGPHQDSDYGRIPVGAEPRAPMSTRDVRCRRRLDIVHNPRLRRIEKPMAANAVDELLRRTTKVVACTRTS